MKRADSLKQNGPQQACAKPIGRSSSLAKRENAVQKKQQANEKAKQSSDVLVSLSKLSFKDGPEPQSYSAAMLPPEITDIDALDKGNLQLCSQYAKDIYNYLSDLEVQYPIRANFLSGKREITAHMRAILVNWLVQVHSRFNLLQETLYLTIAILDRYLQAETVSRPKLQLVGVAALFIAIKYEEMYCPDISDFIYIADNAYTKKDLLKMEIVVLKCLGFSLGRPLPLHFLRRASKAGMVDASVHNLAKYLLELTIIEYDMAHIRPSLLAAAALWVSLQLLGSGVWTKDLTYYSRYTEKDMEPVASRMCRNLLSAAAPSNRLNAIYNKYKSSKFEAVSCRSELQSSKVRELAAKH